MKLEPIGERVVLEPFETEEKTKGGIYIPDTAKETKKEGKVLAVGKSKDGKVLPLKEGDHVIYGGYSSEELEIDGRKLVVVDFKDVVARVQQ